MEQFKKQIELLKRGSKETINFADLPPFPHSPPTIPDEFYIEVLYDNKPHKVKITSGSKVTDMIEELKLAQELDKNENYLLVYTEDVSQINSEHFTLAKETKEEWTL